jgi:hypothetical protein
MKLHLILSIFFDFYLNPKGRVENFIDISLMIRVKLIKIFKLNNEFLEILQKVFYF